MKKNFFAAALAILFVGATPNKESNNFLLEHYDPPKTNVIDADNNSIQNDADFEFFEREAECMAKNMYFEAATEGEGGWLSVTLVVLNRVSHPKYPNTVCEVVTQARHNKWFLEVYGKEVPLRNKCQFSWFCDGKPDHPRIIRVYDEMLELSRMILSGDVVIEDVTRGALHYHADYVSPSWAKSMKMTVKVGSHIFYATN